MSLHQLSHDTAIPPRHIKPSITGYSVSDKQCVRLAGTFQQGQRLCYLLIETTVQDARAECHGTQENKMIEEMTS